MKNIFIHGLGQTSAAWNQVISEMDGIYENECPDLLSLLKGREINYKNIYNSIVEYCDGVSEPLNLCGLSLGGVIALQYTIENPEKVNSLVLVGAQYEMPKFLLKIQNMIFHFLPKKMFEQMGMEKQDVIKITKSMMGIDLSDGLQKIRCSTLIVCGSRDKANMKSALQLHRMITNSKIEIISEAGHEVNLDNPKDLAIAINKFYG